MTLALRLGRLCDALVSAGVFATLVRSTGHEAKPVGRLSGAIAQSATF